jgi:hypothetical protein
MRSGADATILGNTLLHQQDGTRPVSECATDTLVFMMMGVLFLSLGDFSFFLG